MSKILCLGNALTDVLTQISDDCILNELNLPKGSMTHIPAERYAEFQKRMLALPIEVATGGSASNTALCLARMGADVRYASRLNEKDYFGTFFCRKIREAGVELCVMPCLPTENSGVCSAFISPDGQRTFATYLGATAQIRPEDVDPAYFEGVSIVHIEGYWVFNRAVLDRAIALAKEAGALISLDMASYNVVEDNLDYFRQILPMIDIVFANEEEAAAFHYGHLAERPTTESEQGIAPPALTTLASMCRTAVVKVGAQGAWAQSDDEMEYCPAEKIVNVIDTTAAGDFFAAGFLLGISRSMPLREALRIGTHCSANVIQVIGTNLSSTMWDEIREFIHCSL